MQRKHASIAKFNAEHLTVGVVTSRFNREITEKLRESALAAITGCKVKKQNITELSVAGAMEIPFALQKLAKAKKYDCLVALGAVIRGETPHFDYVCKMAQEGTLRVSLDHRIPIGFGIITVNNLKQAGQRLHVGAEAAIAAIELSLL